MAGDPWAEIAPNDAVPDATGYVRPVVRIPFRREDVWDRPIDPWPGSGPLRPVVAEMQADASRVVRLLAPAPLLVFGGLAAVTAWTLTPFLVIVVPALVLWGSAVLLAPLTARSSYGRIMVPTQLANLRPLPGPRRLESATDGRGAGRMPRTLVVPAYLFPVVGSGLAAWIGSTRTDAGAEVVGVLPLFLVLGGAVTVANGVASARALRRLARYWEEWEAYYGVLLVREPTTLPNGFAWMPRRRVTTPAWSSAARWPPGQMGVGWYWVAADRVHAGAVG